MRPQIRTPAGSEGDSIRTCGQRARGGGSEDACASAARSERRRRRSDALETWERFSAADPLTPRAVEQMVLGVSTRKYIRSIEPAPPGFKTRGTSKSAVSRRFVTATREKLAEMMSRDLGQIALCAIMIDDVHVGEHLVLVALGIDDKAIDIRLASTKAPRRTRPLAAACSRTISKPAACAPTARCSSSSTAARRSRRLEIRAKFGARALIQRYRVHKKRNIEDHLPDEMKRNAERRTISAAYQSRDAPRAGLMLEGLARRLERKHILPQPPLFARVSTKRSP